MMRRLLAALALGIPSAAACLEPELGHLFARRADLRVAHDGLVMLVLPPEVLAETQPDLSDLRILDRAGREVPFFVEAKARRLPAAEPLPAPKVRAVAREIRTPEGEPPHVLERYELSLPEAPADPLPRPGERLALRIGTQQGSFVRSVRVEQKAPDGTLALLAKGAPLFSIEGATRTQIVLPPSQGTLVVTIEGREGVYLEPRFGLVRLEDVHAEAAPAVVPLVVLSQQAREGTTTLEVARPLGLVPDGLRVATDTGTFSRRAAISDLLPDGTRVALGGGPLVRLESVPGVEGLELPLRQAARGEKLLLEVADRDSPPLANLRVFALVKQPALVFALESHADGLPDGTLHFGGGQAFRAVYDLASLRELVPDPAQLGRVLAELRENEVQLGPVHVDPAFAPRPPLAFARQAGALLDLQSFSHRRSFTIAPSANGLSRLRLSPEDVALARPDLADLRVVGEDGAQWPFLLAAEAAREWRPVAISAPASLRRESRYQLELPWPRIPAEALELDSDAPFFDRAYRLTARDADGAERVIARGRLVRDPLLSRPVRIALSGERIGSLELRVDDGDDAPLLFTQANLRVLLPELFVTALPGVYGLVLGDPDAELPRYELERVRDVVLAVPSASIQAGPLEMNPVFSPTRALTSGLRGRTLLVWTALATAVGVLAALTLRAARREST
jgi:hypothetical protein